MAKKPQEPLGRHVLLVAGVVVIGTFMTIVDATIVGVAIETLARDFESPLTTIQWLMTGYTLALAVVIPLTGWATDRFGGKQLWMTAVGVFSATSVLCALSWSVESLIVFRVLQGIGGGMVVPVSMTLVAQVAGRERMGRVMSIVGVPLVLGPIAGPVLGGLLLEASWHWIFIINVPVGVIALVLAARIFPATPPKPADKLDLLGLVLLCPAVGLLVFGLSELSSGERGEVGWTTSTVVVLAAAVVLLALFVAHALRRANTNPLLDLRQFKNNIFTAAVVIQALLGAALYGSGLLLPLYYQVVRGESPLTAGLLLIPQGIGVAIMMPISGPLVDKGKAAWVVMTGLPLLTLGFFGFTQAHDSTSYVLLSASLLVMGMGAGCTMMPLISTMYRVVEPRAVPRATATMNITQRVGGAVGTAVFAVTLQHFLTTVDGGYTVSDAFNSTFWWPLALPALAIVPALLLFRVKAGPQGGAPGGGGGVPRQRAEAPAASTENV